MAKPASTVVAVDLGAESGRVVAAAMDGQKVRLDVSHRFPNVPVRVGDRMYWDVLHLWSEIQAGIHQLKDRSPASVGMDTWGVDFGLLDRQGRLMGNPVHYRDVRTDGMLERAFSKVPQAEIFKATGIQFMQINSLYQLLSMVEMGESSLQTAATFLTIPDLINYWLTGEKACEFTNATTTQCLDPHTCNWAGALLERLGIPVHIFPTIIPPGTRLGTYEGITVVAPACHDTGSAVVAVPAASPNFAYISSGTWSLLGLEVPQAVVSPQALRANLTNEGGVAGTFRLLKNVMGLWLLQQSRATWASQGKEYEYSELVRLAEKAKPFGAMIDPDHLSFLHPGDMPSQITRYCQKTGQTPPDEVGAVVRCILESLALKYRYYLDLLVEVSGQPVEVIHVIGGGSQNALLCQMTANATGRPVMAGPVEAAALGNALMQWITIGELGSISQARQMVQDSVDLQSYLPKDTQAWNDALGRFESLLSQTYQPEF